MSSVARAALECEVLARMQREWGGRQATGGGEGRLQEGETAGSCGGTEGAMM